VDNPYDIAANPHGQLTGPSRRPATPGRHPITAAGEQVTGPAGTDPRATAVPPGRDWHPAAVGGSPAAARAPTEPVLPSRRPSRGAREVHALGNQVARPRHRPDEVDLDPAEAAMSQGVIDQEELEALDALNRQRREIDEERKALSGSILARLANGSAVQQGRYQVQRQISNSCRLTFGALEGLYGEDFVHDLREHLEVKQYVRLKLWEPGGGRPPRAGGRGRKAGR
jgi:hypothetical protein